MARIAFVTDEYPSSSPTEGGLATYVARMADLLTARGHEVHVFVQSADADEFMDGEIYVHGVARDSAAILSLQRLIKKIPWIRRRRVDYLAYQIGVSYLLARALEKYEISHLPFDIVQSCDLWFRGLFVKKRRRMHVIRCSWARDEFQRLDGVWDDWINRASAMLERVSMRRAHIVYAPSEAVASYYAQTWSIPVRVIRPPLPTPKTDSCVNVSIPLPQKYFLHFGQILRRKGSDLAIDALLICRNRGCNAELVIAGADRTGLLATHLGQPGLHVLGPISRAEVSYALKNALAAVLPSRIDNLPNTAIEALGLGIPVVTTSGSSADEIVDHLINGVIVDADNVEALADAMENIWTGKTSFGFVAPTTERLERLSPDSAVDGFIGLLKEKI